MVCRRWCSTTATPHVLPLTAGRAYYVRVLRSPGAFHDGTRARNFIAYYGDGAGMSCAFSDDGLSWDTEKKVSGIATNGYHVVCALETANRLRILYWNPDVPNQPYAMAGLRTAISDPSVDPAAFTGDTPCAGNLVTEGSVQVWNRGHYGPSFLWYNPLPTSGDGKPFTWRYAMYFIASTGGNDSLGLACSDDAVEWKLIGNGPILSGLIDPQPWEGANGYVSAAHVERLPDGRWWMLYSGGSAGNAGIGYAWSWDRIHWRKAEINPVFKNGSGPFLERCYTPSLVRDADGSLLLYRRPRMEPPTGPSLPVCGLRPWAGATCSDLTGSARGSPRGRPSIEASAPRPNATRPSPIPPWATNGSTPTSRAAASGRNTPGPTGSGADPRNTSLFFGRQEIP
jgi:hypothetical protein